MKELSCPEELYSASPILFVATYVMHVPLLVIEDASINRLAVMIKALARILDEDRSQSAQRLDPA